MSLAAAKIVREILYAPPSMPALDLLAKMQATRIHLALVIDEYGGTDGLVSMEDLVELIVGDIADEHDEREMPAVTHQSDGSFLANGRASLDNVRAVIGDEFDFGEASREVKPRRLPRHQSRSCTGTRRAGARTRLFRGRSARRRSAPDQEGQNLSPQGSPFRHGARVAGAREGARIPPGAPRPPRRRAMKRMSRNPNPARPP